MISGKLFQQYKASVICFGLLAILAGCLSSSEITLKQDGSASVITRNSVPKDHFYESPQISGVSWINDSLDVTFHIEAIDSLGNYLFASFNKNYFRFNYHQDTLTFTDGNGEPFKDRSDYFCFAFSIHITSDRKIKSVQANHRFVRQEGNTVIIYKKGRRFNKKSKDARVVIVFEK